MPGKSHGRRSLVGFSPWGREELDTTERLHFPFSLSCIGEGHGARTILWKMSGAQVHNGEGNGTPLQYSCLENPMDGGAWWSAGHGVARNWTRLSDFTFPFHFHALEKEMATHSSPVFLPGESQGWGTLVGCRL